MSKIPNLPDLQEINIKIYSQGTKAFLEIDANDLDAIPYFLAFLTTGARVFRKLHSKGFKRSSEAFARRKN